MKTEELLRLEFNDWAKAGRGESMERGHRPTGEQAIDRMGLGPDSRVLDLGCGSGWASRLMATLAPGGKVIGIDVSDAMIELARNSSGDYPNLDFRIASAENLPFEDAEFTHAFSMESIYYYGDMLRALKEIRRVLTSGGLFVTVVDLYKENKPSHQWVQQLNVSVQLLSTAEYHDLFEQAGFMDISDERLLDPTPIPEDYSGGSFASRKDYLEYRQEGSLLISGRVGA